MSGDEEVVQRLRLLPQNGDGVTLRPQQQAFIAPPRRRRHRVAEKRQRREAATP